MAVHLVLGLNYVLRESDFRLCGGLTVESRQSRPEETGSVASDEDFPLASVREGVDVHRLNL